MSPDELAKALAQPGRASIPYLDRYNPEWPLMLECFRSQGHDPRQAGRHRTAWGEPQWRGILRGMDPGSQAARLADRRDHVFEGSLAGRCTPTTTATCSMPTGAFGLASAGHWQSPAASLRCCAKQASPGATRLICGVIPPAGNSSIGCWRRNRPRFSRRSEPPIPGGTHCRRSIFTIPTGSAVSG